MLVAVVIRILPIVPLTGQGRAGSPFDGFDPALAQIVQQLVVAVGEQPHQPGGTLSGGGIDPKVGTAFPGGGSPAFPYLVVDHNLVDRLGQEGLFLLVARGDALDLLAVIEPNIALGHPLVLERTLGALGLLRIGEQHQEVADDVGKEGTQGPSGRLLERPVVRFGHQPSPPGYPGSASLPDGEAAGIGGLPTPVCWRSNDTDGNDTT